MLFGTLSILDGGSNGNSLGGGRGVMWRWISAPPPSSATLAITAFAGIVVLALIYTSNKGHIKSPWSQRKRRGALSSEIWRSMFTPDGRLNDDGVLLLKKVRSGGIDQSIRAEVWPFLLGVYDLGSTEEERTTIRSRQKIEYEKLRRQCQYLHKGADPVICENVILKDSSKDNNASFLGTITEGDKDMKSNGLDVNVNIEDTSEVEVSGSSSSTQTYDRHDVQSDCLEINSKLSWKESREESGITQQHSTSENSDNDSRDLDVNSNTFVMKDDSQCSKQTCENFTTWQRIIRVDAVRANSEWMPFSQSQAVVSETTALNFAEAVMLKDYENLEPARVFHAARLVAILEAYAVYDSEIGYCQGMSDLLSPILAVITDDSEAFWCFVGFMNKARHNFRLDEVGIRRQLGIVAKIIKFKDSQLFRHLEKLQAEDCFFVYRMVVVLFRRELSFEQTLCLWEVMWADQAIIRSSVSRPEWTKILLEAPPTDDLLLYAIAACVLQRRKLILEKYSSMDEILRECNSMAGHLDVWKLLDDAHDLVIKIHDKIETTSQ